MSDYNGNNYPSSSTTMEKNRNNRDQQAYNIRKKSRNGSQISATGSYKVSQPIKATPEMFVESDIQNTRLPGINMKNSSSRNF